MNDNVVFAKREDVGVILRFIRELAEYEKMADEVVATDESLERWLFEEKAAEVLFAVDEAGEKVGFALFFHSFSTFLGRPGIFLEDLYVAPEHRGKGYGKALLSELARIALDRGYGRLEWNCLDWNEPSIAFYTSLGAAPMDIWTTYRVIGETLEELANGS